MPPRRDPRDACWKMPYMTLPQSRPALSALFPPLFPLVFAALTLARCGGACGASVAPVAAERGMVVTAQHLASEVGIDVLRQGGNAVDAAVAVGYALAVVYPAAGNLGGGGFMTLQLADGRTAFVDFREKAPLGATRDMFLGPDGNVVPGLTTDSYLSVGVPGTVAGLELARERYGTRPRATLLAPAIRLAQRGFILEQGDVNMLRSSTDDFRKDPAAAAIFLDHGKPYQAGQRLVQTDLARTLGRVSARGPRGFYSGPFSAALVAASHAGGGILTQADLGEYQAKERKPVECDYRGYHIVSAPPPSSGGVILCEMLNVLEGYPLKDLGFRSAQAVHYQIETMRRAYRDRNTYLGDPDFVDNPVDRLLDKRYAQTLRSGIDPARAGISDDLQPGLGPHEGQNTTHYSIADRYGNAVSVTYTLNDWFGARLVAPGTGVLMNNEMDDFTAKVGVANLYGLVQGAPNGIAPGKRPLSSMTPTIVTRDGKPLMVVGTPGGSRIITSVLHAILNVVDYGMNVQEAVDAPRFHQQWLPEATEYEPYAFSPDTQRLLAAMGHKLAPSPLENHLEAILVGAPALEGAPVAAYRFYGANDPRRNTGQALGF
jgi:gamma-glutamyltranspeptidase/glutathione hydrolase